MNVGTLHVIGVRHHSPACARLVAHTIREVRPRFVLVEGPSDMNDRVGEMLLGHELPVAIFSYAQGEGVRRASWSPFCAYSPEWVAIEEARRAGADALFMDLPAWHAAFGEIENRYADRHDRVGQRMTALCERLGLEDTDSLWDHLFEQPMAASELRARLGTYFRELREGDEPGERDRVREAYMARWIAWAMAEAGGSAVVAVCGGYHAPELEAASRSGLDTTRPEIPTLEGARVGSYLVPYSFRRLDAFQGYASGMPSPEFYQRVWEEGAEAAGEAMLFSAIEHLRRKKQRVSPADSIAALTLARGLKALRGHEELARVDVLDGLAAAVVKDALDAPLPWNRRGVLARATEPMLVEMVAAFSGERIGKLARATPRPPLVEDVREALAAIEVVPKRNVENVRVELAGKDPVRGLGASRVLHRLRVLGVPGFTLVKGPSLARASTDLAEVWAVTDALDREAALIEASAYGATLEGAAAAVIEQGVRRAAGIADLAKLLYEAARIGVDTLTLRLAHEIRHVAGNEPDFGALGGALARVLALYKHDVLLGSAGAQLLGETIEAAFDRGLWLLEGIDGQAGRPEVDAAVALRDALRLAGASLALDGARAEAVMHRRVASHTAPPAIRGAAMGFLWSVRSTVSEDEIAHAVRSAGRPETLGDFLSGLFALAREEVLHAPALLAVVDGLVTPMTRTDFLVAVPSLRLAFSYFPPREKEAIAARVLALHGLAGGDVRKMTRLDVHPGVTMAGLAVDARADELARRFGLLDALDAPAPGGGSSP